MKAQIYLMLLLIISGQTYANIYIRGPNIEQNSFVDIVKEKQGIQLSRWLLDNDRRKSKIDPLIDLGEKYLSSEISLADFLFSIEKLNDHSAPDLEWRQALVDILVKKSESLSSHSTEIWDQICYFFNLDENIQTRWSQFYQQCNKNQKIKEIEKPVFLKNDVVIIDGIEWVDKVKFYLRKKTNPLKIQIRIYSDMYSPVFIKKTSMDIEPPDRLTLSSDDCGEQKNQLNSLLDYPLPLYQVQIVKRKNCIESADPSLAETKSNFWTENKKWIWIGGLAMGALFIYQAQDHEISFDWP
ncbi:MAG: hypothetical protein AABY64_07540 [Bdellovibrionota bacterium]